MNTSAKVWLVGAGPGDPELLTIKAARLLTRARVVLYDHLVGDEVLGLVPADALRVYVGKQEGCHAVPQEEISRMLVRFAAAGSEVVRLKGGDPLVFGRGGEEAQALARAGIPFEVVPGITSAQGMSACAGIPLTHRDHASSVVLVTGHTKDDEPACDWASLARPRQTVVFYMGLRALPRICRELIAHGMAVDMPAAVVERATTPQQRVVTGTLLTLAALARAHEVRSPALVVVGDVVRLREELVVRGSAVATDTPAPETASPRRTPRVARSRTGAGAGARTSA